MRIAGRYSFNKGLETVQERSAPLLEEIEQIIGTIDASDHKTTHSKKRTGTGHMAINPRKLSDAFRLLFRPVGWSPATVKCDYSTEFYTKEYKPKPMRKGAFRQMDFVKEKLGVEVQLGKYAFMVYNVCAEMTIFHKLGFIDTGVEIVPVKSFADEMSTGVSYFEQFVWDLERRGVCNIDIPVLILGIDA